MHEASDNAQSKTLSDLGNEALWFALHTIFAIVFLAVMIAGMTMTQPDPDALNPKLLGTVLALLFPMIGGFFIARSQQNHVAGYVWISGLLLFSVVCVWVLDLPTGNGLCEKCGAIDKLSRTFFSISNGSGLMGGDGLLVGTWVPLAIIGYSIGAKFGLDKRVED